MHGELKSQRVTASQGEASTPARLGLPRSQSPDRWRQVLLLELRGWQHLDELRTGGDEPLYFVSVDRCWHQPSSKTLPKIARAAAIASSIEMTWPRIS